MRVQQRELTRFSGAGAARICRGSFPSAAASRISPARRRAVASVTALAGPRLISARLPSATVMNNQVRDYLWWLKEVAEFLQEYYLCRKPERTLNKCMFEKLVRTRILSPIHKEPGADLDSLHSAGLDKNNTRRAGGPMNQSLPFAANYRLHCWATQSGITTAIQSMPLIHHNAIVTPLLSFVCLLSFALVAGRQFL